MLKIIFPCDYFKVNKVDADFFEQALACDKLGIQYASVNLDHLNHLNHLNIESEAQILYRGWMRTKEEYEEQYDALKAKGQRMFIDPHEYLRSHHLPLWYHYIEDLTPKTIVLACDNELVNKIDALGWGKYFLKDYVKSLSTNHSPIVRNKVEIKTLISHMRHYRGNIEGGICVRQVENFLAETEERYFVVNGTAFSRTNIVPDIVLECTERLPNLFYSVDICQNAEGNYRIIEIGDGQVSDLKSWTAEQFYKMILKASWL